MCGAFSIIHPFRDLSQKFNAGYNDTETKPRYNVRPSQSIPAILNTDPDEIVHTFWGIQPPFIQGKRYLINARDDSLNKPTWNKLLHEQRCLILADGFFEWKKSENVKVKTPFYFTRKDKEPFAFAGLWKLNKAPNGEEIPHTVIITTEPNELVADVHNRMPAMLDPKEGKEWLNPDISPEEAKHLLRPYDPDKMSSYAISTLINKPTNDIEEVIQPTKNSA